MYYVLYNPKSGGFKTKRLLKLEKYLKKKGLEYKLLNYLEIKLEQIIENTKADDFLVIAGGDGTINHYLSEESRDRLKARVLLYKAGSGNDFAREHKGFLVDITSELQNAPYYILDNEKHYFINGVGMGIDAAVCDAVNKNSDGSYFKTAVNIFKSFKSYSLKISVDGKEYNYDNVFFFVAMNGKYIGGGMKVAPEAKRDDGIFEIYIIKAKSYKRIIPIFPLIYLGLHKIARKNVIHLRGRSIRVSLSDKYLMQADGEVTAGLNELEIHTS